MTPPSMPYVAISVGSGWMNAKDAFLYGGVLFLLSAISAVAIGYPLGVFFWNLGGFRLLDKQRAEIDAIDREIVALFERRMQVVVDVARIKKRKWHRDFRCEREKEVDCKVQSYLKDATLKEEFGRSLRDFDEGSQRTINKNK